MVFLAVSSEGMKIPELGKGGQTYGQELSKNGLQQEAGFGTCRSGAGTKPTCL